MEAHDPTHAASLSQKLTSSVVVVPGVITAAENSTSASSRPHSAILLGTDLAAHFHMVLHMIRCTVRYSPAAALHERECAAA